MTVMLSTLWVCCGLLTAFQIATASVVRLDCLESINVCQAATVKFVCHITGDEIEWGNTSSSDNRIRLETEGASVTLGSATAVITSKQISGIMSEYRINVTPGIQFGYTRIYCEDRGDGGGEIQCPRTVITPALPSSPTNLMINSINNNIATVQWSPPNTDVLVSGYSITITPAPGSGSCSGGTCSVSAQICPMSSPSCNFAITDLQYAQLYTVNVQSMNCRGSSSGVFVQFNIQNPPITATESTEANILSSTQFMSAAVTPSKTTAIKLSSQKLLSSSSSSSSSSPSLSSFPSSLTTISLSMTGTTTSAMESLTQTVIPSSTKITSSAMLPPLTSLTSNFLESTSLALLRSQALSVSASDTPVMKFLPITSSPSLSRTFRDAVITVDNSIQLTETMKAQSLLDTNMAISAKPSLTHGVTPVTTGSTDISQAVVLPVQWIVLGAVVPMSVIITATVTAFIVWCCLTRKRTSQLKQTAQTVSVEERALHSYNNELQRKSEHIYSEPINYNRDSLVYNSAYQHSISLSSNPAYQASLKMEYKCHDQAV